MRLQSKTASPADFQPTERERIGAYEITSRIAHGGMATLYLAKRQGALGFSRHVAIKAIHPHLSSDPDFSQMFIDEAILTTYLSHPNIVTVEEFGEDHGQLFLVMEYVKGQTLSALRKFLRVRGRSFSLPLTVHIMAEVASALHAAHEACAPNGVPLDVVHRDITPGNILISEQGHIKVIDFGISRSAARSFETRTTSLKGKIAYMSPEQAQGMHLDRRSDIYSLGLLTWELITNRRAFPKRENDLALLQDVQHPNIAALRDMVDVPRALSEAVRKALRVDRSERPESAAAYRDMLLRAVPDALEVEPNTLGRLVCEVEPVGSADPPSQSRARRATVTLATKAPTPECDHAAASATQAPAGPTRRDDRKHRTQFVLAVLAAAAVGALIATLLLAP